jgi:TatD DNase family protein
MLVDTHNHVQHEAFDEDREVVLARALESLQWFVIVGDTVEASRAGAEIAASRDNIYATAGIHPHHAKDVTPEMIEELRAVAAHPSVVALGEIGLDYHYDFSPREAQRTALETQLELAVELRLPVVIHCREADDDMSAILDRYARRLSGGVMHCFGGDMEFARKCLTWGFYISFAGNVTFPKAETLKQVAAWAPLDRLLVETDAPYLAPQPVRGKRCEPIHVAMTADYIAKLRSISPEELAAATSRNAAEFYGLA